MIENDIICQPTVLPIKTNSMVENVNMLTATSSGHLCIKNVFVSFLYRGYEYDAEYDCIVEGIDLEGEDLGCR